MPNEIFICSRLYNIGQLASDIYHKIRGTAATDIGDYLP